MAISGKLSIRSQITGNINGYGNVKGQLDKAKNVKELEFKNRFEFPSIGNKNMLYIATDEDAAYIFDTAENVYRCIGRDYNEIGTIQCRLKED